MAQTQGKLPGLLHRLYPRVNTRIVVPFLIVAVLIVALGVFIVTRLEAHQAEIRLTSELEWGTTVSIRLPVPQAVTA